MLSPVIAVRDLAIRIQARQPGRGSITAETARRPGSESPQRMASTFGQQVELGRGLINLADEAYYAAIGVRSVDGGLGAPAHLDAVQEIGRDMREIKISADAKFIYGNAIDQDQIVVGLAPAK